MSKKKILDDHCGTETSVAVSGCCVEVVMRTDDKSIVATLYSGEVKRLEKMLRKARKELPQDDE